MVPVGISSKSVPEMATDYMPILSKLQCYIQFYIQRISTVFHYISYIRKKQVYPQHIPLYAHYGWVLNDQN